MGKFRNQKKNMLKNKVAVSQGKAKQMKATLKQTKKAGESDVQMSEDVPRGLAVSSLKKLASGELTNVPKVNEKKIIRKNELPVREGKKLLDAPSGKRGTTAQYISTKKGRKMYKRMTQDARETFRKLKAEAAAEGGEEEDEDVEMDE